MDLRAGKGGQGRDKREEERERERGGFIPLLPIPGIPGSINDNNIF